VSTAEELRARFAGRTPVWMDQRYRCAVLCPLVERADGLHLLFEVRAASLRRQPGEVCFPGGRAEGGESAETCALRETEEELRIPREHICLLGRPDFIYSHAGFLMEPVLGLVDEAGFAGLTPSSAEVADVFTAPLSFFQETAPQPLQYTLVPQPPADFPYADVGFPQGYRWASGAVDVPVWHYEGHVIWGLTARIVRNLVEILK
jgi:coenzyme A diphosphatase NUDT7